MVPTDYVGVTPNGGLEGTQIDRVTTHHVWAVESLDRPLREPRDRDHPRRVTPVVRLVSRERTSRVDCRYLCDESCVREWAER